MNIINEIKQAYYNANTVEKVIYIQVTLFLVGLISQSFIANWLALKPAFAVFISQPWTLITYGFFHGNFIHLIFNLIFLFYIGNLFINFFTVKQFLNYFLLGIASGGLAFLILQPQGFLVGSSAGIMAVLVGLATKIPTYEIRFNLIGGVKIWIIAAIYVGVSLVGLDGLNSGGNIAHLGGALLGFIYTKQLQGGSDIGIIVENFMNSILAVFKSKKQNPLKTVHKKKNIKRKPTHKEQNAHQQKIDGILDKISKSGYESLTKVEKDFLFKAGKK
jgi:membrane associated rhomboid family serine protease